MLSQGILRLPLTLLLAAAGTLVPTNPPKARSKHGTAGTESTRERRRRDVVESALFEIQRVIAGQDEMLERVFVCLLAGGHLLIEAFPGSRRR